MNRESTRTTLAKYFERPVAHALATAGISPNTLTFAGLLASGAAAYCLSEGLMLIGGLVLLASGPFDMLDGAVARITGRVSKFGAVLDSTADRIAEAGFLLGMTIYFHRDDNLVGVALAFGAIVGSMTVSYLRARAGSLGIDARGGLMTRPERLVMLGVGLIIAEWWLPLATIVVGGITALTILTSLQRLVQIKRMLNVQP